MKETTKQFIILFFLVASVVYLGVQMRDFTLEANQCVKNPFVWGASDTIERQEDYDMMDCSCTIYNSNGYGKEYFFYFSNVGNNPDHLVPKNTYPMFDINVSHLK